MVEMVVLGEDDPTWLQHKIRFKNLRHVHYYLAAARWARPIEQVATPPDQPRAPRHAAALASSLT